MKIKLSRRWLKIVLEYRLLFFLITLITQIIIFPIIQQAQPSYIILNEIIFNILLIIGIYIISDNGRIISTAILTACLAFIIIRYNLWIKSDLLLIIGLSLQIIFFSMVAYAIISYVLQPKKISADKIYGAISGYLILGLIWTLIYIMIETIEPSSFAITQTKIQDYDNLYTHRYYLADLIYYSFVTMSTLGYGDIVPLSSLAKLFSALQAVTGQLYVAILIARLVGLHISTNDRKN